MYKIYFVYLIDPIEKSYLSESVIDSIPKILNVEDKYNIRLYAVTDEKEIYKRFMSERCSNLFLTHKREYETKIEVEETLNDLSMYVLSENPYAYQYDHADKKTIELLSTEFEYDFCVYGVVEDIWARFNDMDGFTTFKPRILKEKYQKALETLGYDEILFNIIDPDSSAPWKVFEVNELNVFILLFGFTMESGILKERIRK